VDFDHGGRRGVMDNESGYDEKDALAYVL